MYKAFYIIRIIPAFLLIIGAISVSYGQSKDDVIKRIKADFQAINTDKTLRIVKLDDNKIPGPETDGGREIIGYIKGNEIYKIHEWVGLSFGVRQCEYYFKNGKLFFVYEEEKDFPFDKSKQGLNHEKLVPAFEGRYYLDHDKIIDVKSKGRKKFEDKSGISVKDLEAAAENCLKIVSAYLKKKK